MITSKTRATSFDDQILDKNAASLRPGMNRRPLSVAVGLEDFNERELQLKITKQQSGSYESLSAQSDSSAIDSEYSEEEMVHLNLEEENSPQFGPRNGHGSGSPNRKKYVVTRSFVAEESGEVSLEEGEEVDVLQKNFSGWWYVKNDFCEGCAPSAFLAPGRSRSVSPETLDQHRMPDSQEEPCQIKENLDTSPKLKRDDVKRLIPQGKEKVASTSIR